MRVSSSVNSVSYTTENASRNCRPSDSCSWINAYGYPKSGVLTATKSIVRDDIRRTPQGTTGWRPPLPYAMTATEQGIATGSVFYQALRGYGDNAGGGNMLRRDGALYRISVDSDFSPVTANEDARLKARALSRAKAQQIDLAMAFASRRSTFELLASSAARLAKAYSQARQRNFAGAARTLGIRNSVRPGTKSASSGWLQLQFGWMPLMSDIHGLYGELTTNHPKDGELVVVRASDRHAEAVEEVFTHFPWSSSYTGAIVKRRTIATRDVKVSYWYVLNSEALHAAARNGLTDPLVVAWDVLPFSFVADWLFPVGQYLRNLTADVGFTYRGGSRTYFERREVVDKSIGVTKPTHATHQQITATATVKGAARGVKMERLAVPSPKAEMYIKNPFSTFTVVTSFSLLLQAFQSDAPWRKLRL